MTNEPIFTIRSFRYPEDLQPVRYLWSRSGPGVHLSRSDEPDELALKLKRDPDLFLVAEVDQVLVGTVLGGYDGRRGMVYHLAVDTDFRRKGVATSLMSELERRFIAKGCMKMYLMIVADNQEVVEFYRQRGWDLMNVTLMGKVLR